MSLLPSTDLAAAPGDRVLPRFDGRGLLNLVTSLSAHLGLPPASPLFSAPLPLDGVERVALLVIDGLGHFLLARHLERGEMPWLASQLAQGVAGYQTATSTLPSSTMIALTTIHMGLPPAQHGWLATTIYASGGVVDVLRQADMSGQPHADPDRLISTPPLYRRLRDAGVPSGSVNPAAYQGTFLDRFYFDGAQPFPYGPQAALPGQVARALEEVRYVMAYWPEYDTVCHGYGPSSAEAAQAARRVDDLVREVVEGLPQDGRTLLVVSADHGQRDTPAAESVALHGPPPAGENRLRYFAHEPTALPAGVTLRPSAELWAEGLFGGLPARPEFLERTGAYTAVVQDATQLTYDYGSGPLILKGNHGGWSAEEMVVPVLTFRR